MGKGLSEMLERGEQEGVVVELEERWNRRSRRWEIRKGGGGGQEVRIGHVASKYLLLYHLIT